MPALYGAAGVDPRPRADARPARGGRERRRRRVALPLDRGARPGVPPAACSSTAADPEPIVLAHALDYDHPEHVKILLAAGADAERVAARSPSVAGAGRRSCGCSSTTARNSRRAAARTGASRSARRTAYQHAVLRGRDDSAQTLAELGADTHVDADDLAVAAIARGERPETVPTDLDYDQQEVLSCTRSATAWRTSSTFTARTSAASSAARRRAHCSSTSAWVGHAEYARFLVGAGAAIGDSSGLVRPRFPAPRDPRPRLRRRGRSAAAPSSSSATWSRRTVRWPSGSKHGSDRDPERDVISPLAALRQRLDRREQPAQDRQVERGDRERRRRRRTAARPAAAAPPPGRTPTRSIARGAPARPPPAARRSGARSAAAPARARARPRARRRAGSASTASTGTPTRRTRPALPPAPVASPPQLP